MPNFQILSIKLNDLFKLTENNTDPSAVEITVTACLITFLVALICGAMISLTYRKTSGYVSTQGGFPLALAALPAVISVIILLAGSSVARAFSLAGAFALVRFRSVAGEPKDIVFVCLTMAIGLALGMGFALYAFMFTVILCLAIFLFAALGFTKGNQDTQLLRITVPENMPFENRFEGIMNKYGIKHELDKVQMANLGSLFELHYTVKIPKTISKKDFIDELRLHNGNLNISINYLASPKVK